MADMPQNADPPEVRIARIQAWQAITLAILTGVGGFAASYFTTHREAPARPLASDLKTRAEPEHSDTREAVIKFVTDYFKASEGAQAEDAIAFFDGVVDFQDSGLQTYEQLRAATFDYHQKYPDRHYDVSPHMDVFPDGQLTKVRAMLSYRLGNKDGTKNGDALNLIWLRVTGKSYRITKVREAILSSQPQRANTAETSVTPAVPK